MTSPKLATVHVTYDDDQIVRCFPVMVQLRPHLVEAEFVSRIRKQFENTNYRLVRIQDENDAIVAVAGYYYVESLSSDKYMYVADLVTDNVCRSKGYGSTLFDWLIEEAKREGCKALSLDSGVNRHGAHRFYLSKRMDITSHHFAVTI